jgi:hypothetical protein
VSPRRVVKVQGYSPPRPRAEIALAAGASAAVILWTVLEIWLLEPNGLARRQPRAYIYWHAAVVVFVGCFSFLQRHRTHYTARRFLAALPLLALAFAALAFAFNDNDADTDWFRGAVAVAIGLAVLWALVEVLVVVRRRLPEVAPKAIAAAWAGGITLLLAVAVWFTVPGGIVRTIAPAPSPVLTPTTTSAATGTAAAPNATAPAGSTTTAGASTAR